MRRLTVLRIWRTLEQKEHSILQIMVRGLHRKWKQPVAYCVNGGSTKVKFSIGVLDVCQNGGLRIVAIICDMGAKMSRP